MALKYEIEIVHEGHSESLNYSFYSGEEMTPDEIFNAFIAELSIIPNAEEVDAVQCETCADWTEDYQQREDNGLNLCPACYNLAEEA
jgi:formylmethanofuran dehydrogenase subunit E